jgi:hypothetical protein
MARDADGLGSGQDVCEIGYRRSNVVVSRHVGSPYRILCVSLRLRAGEFIAAYG